MDYTKVTPLQPLASVDGADTPFTATSLNQLGINDSNSKDLKQPLIPVLDGLSDIKELQSKQFDLLSGTLPLTQQNSLNHSFQGIKKLRADHLTGHDDIDLLVGQQDDSFGAIAPSTHATSQEIVFIDASADDYQTLVSGVAPSAEVIVLDSAQDGIAQISAVLSNRQNVSSVHIVSHGENGLLQLGSTRLTETDLSQYANQIQSWKTALTVDADILLYGCNVAADGLGQTLVQDLSYLTGADVAASNDLTGSAALGGDWDLEVQIGQIETAAVFLGSTIAEYGSVLAAFSGNKLFTVSTSFNENVVITGDTTLNVDGDFDLGNLGHIVGDGVGAADNITIKASGLVTLGGFVGDGGLQNVTIEATKGIRLLDGSRIATPGDVQLIAKAGFDLTFGAVTPFFKDRTAQTSIEIGAASLNAANITILSDATTRKFADFDLDDSKLEQLVGNLTPASLTGTPKLTFADSDSQPATITRESGSWIADGFAIGQEIAIQGSRDNNGSYTIASLNDKAITLIETDVLQSGEHDPTIELDTVAIDQVVQLDAKDLLLVVRDRNGNPIPAGDLTSGDLVGPDGLLETFSASGVLDLISVGAQALLSNSSSIITIKSGAVINAIRNVTINSSAISDVSLSTPSFIAGGTYGDSAATAKTILQSGVTVIAGNNVAVNATVENTLNVKTSVQSGLLKEVAGATLGKKIVKVPGPSLAFTYGKVRSTSETTIANGATINAFNDVTINAGNTNDVKLSTGSSIIFPKTNLGQAAGVTISDVDSQSKTEVAGTISSQGDFVTISAQSINKNNDANTKASVKNKLPLEGTEGPGKILKPVGDKITGLGNKLDARSEPGKLGISAGVTIVKSHNQADAAIASTGIVTARGDISVTSRAEDNFKSSAVGGAKSGAEISIGGAVAITDYTNTANALIADNAIVQSGNAIKVTADAIIPNQVEVTDDLKAIAGFDYNFPAGFDTSSAENFFRSLYDYSAEAVGEPLKVLNRVVPYLNLQLGVPDKIATSFVGASAQAGDKKKGDKGRFALSGTVNVMDVANSANAWIGQGAHINQNMLAAALDQSVTVAANAIVETINVGGITSVLDLYPGPTKSEGSSLGGTYNGITYNNSAKAFIADGALVTAKGDVGVTANSKNFTVNFNEAGGEAKEFGVAGTFALNRFTNTTLAYIEDTAKINAGDAVTVTADHDAFGVIITGTLISGGNAGVGASVAVSQQDNTTKAFIGNQVTSTGFTPGSVTAGGDVTVKATTTEKLIGVAIAAAIGSGGDIRDPSDPLDGESLPNLFGEDPVKGVEQTAGLGISGDVSINDINDTTYAYISDNVTVNAGGNLAVKADNSAMILAVSGAVALEISKPTDGSGGGAIAGSFTLNDLDRDVQAYTRNATLTAGTVEVSAETNDKLLSVTAGSGVVARQGKGAVAGSVNLNLINSNTDAALGDGTTLTSVGSVGVHASDTLSGVSVAGTFAFSDKGAIGAGADVGVSDRTTHAFIGKNAKVNAFGNVEVTAATDTNLISVAANVAVAPKGLGLSGSGASQTIKTDTQAFIDTGAIVNTDQSLLVDSNDDTFAVVVGGQAAGGQKGGFGASVGNSNIQRTVKSFIADGAMVSARGFGSGVTNPNSTANNTVSGNGIVINANANDELYIFGAGGAGSDKVAFAASAVANTMTSTVDAYIGNGAQINPTNAIADGRQSVQVRANHDTTIISAAGAVSVGSKAGLGAAADVEVINKTVRASIGSAATVNALQHVLVNATSKETMINIAAGIGGSSSVGLAGSATVLTLNTTTQALIGEGATVFAGGNVSVAAHSDANLQPIAGAGGFSGNFGFGVSNTTLVKTNKTEAIIGKNATVTALGTAGAIAAFTGDRDADGNLITGTIQGVSVTATAKQDIVAVTAGAGVGTETAGVAGSAAVNVLNETTRAVVDEGAKINDINANAGANQSVNLLAANDTTLRSAAGGFAFGGTAGGGAGADVGVITKTTEAYMAAGASTNATGDVKIQALSNEDIISVSGSAGISGEVGVAGSAGVYTLNDTTNAYVGNNARIAADGSVIVAADDQTDLNVIAGSLAVGVGTASVGASAGVPVITKKTNSYIGDGATVDAKGRGAGVTVRTGKYDESFVDEANEDGNVKAPAIQDSNVTDPNINKQRVATAKTQTVTGVAVTATSQNDVEIYAVGGGGGVYAAVQLAGAVNVLTNTTTASIGSNARINTNTPDAAIGQSVVVAAGSDYSHLGVAGAAGLSAVAVTPGADVAIATNVTTASIGQGAQVNAVKDVQVSAEASESLLSISASLAGSGAVGVAGAASVVSLNNTTQALIANDAIVNAGGNVLVNADDKTNSDIVAGSLGVGLAGGGGGGSVVVGLITKRTSAEVGDRAQITAKGNGDTAVTAYTGATNADGTAATETRKGLVVQAHSSEDLFGVTATGSGGTYFGISGAVSVNIVDSDTKATIGNGAAINSNNTGAALDQSVTVVAVNEAKINSITGSAAISGSGSLSGGVDVGILRNDTTADIGDGTTVSAQQDVEVNALAIKDVDSLAISGSGGAVALAAAVTVYAIGGNLDSKSRESLTQGNNTVGGYVNSQAGVSGVPTLLGGYSNQDREGEDNTQLVQQYTSNAKTSVQQSSLTDQVGNTITTDMPTTDTPLPSGTSATISGGARVNAGRDVEVEAQDQLDLDITAGGGGLGIGSVGGSVVIANINGNTTATIAEGATVNAALVDSAGDVTVKANLEKSTLTGKAYGGSGGIVALGAQVVILNDNSDRTAEVKSGAMIGHADAVNIIANADRQVDAQSLGGVITLGGLAAGASVAHATLGGATQTVTGADVTIRQANAIDVDATSHLDSNAKAIAVAVGTGFASGAGADSKAIIGGRVSAAVGDRNTLQAAGAISVQSDVQTKAKAESLGIAVSASFAPSLSVGVSLAEATITPSISTSVGQNSTLSAGQPINLVATHTQLTDGAPQAKANASGGGTLVGANGSYAKVTIAPTVTATVNPGASLTSGGAVNLHAISLGEEARAVAEGLTVSLGGAAGASLSEATIGGTTEAQLNGATVNAAALSVTAQSSGTANANAQADAGGLLGAGNGSAATVTINPTTRATIGSNSTVNVTQNVEVKATTATTADTNAEGIGVGGAVQIGVSLAKTSVTPTVEALVGSNSSITAGQDVTVQGSHTNTHTNATASASGGSGLLSGNGADARSTLTATVKGNVSAGVAIAAGRDVAVGAISTGSANAAADGLAFAGIAGVGVTIANATANGTTQAGMDGSVTGATNLTVVAQSDQTSSATAETTSGGIVAGGRGSTANATTQTSTDAHIGNAATVTVSNDVTLNAISTTDADATAKGRGGAAGDIGRSTATATMNPTLAATVGQGATLTAGGDIRIEAKQGKVVAISDGTFNPSSVNSGDDSITLGGSHGLNTGDQITYSTGDAANQPVGGLADGRSYNIIRVDDRTVRLGNTIDPSQIANDRDTIQFFGPADPETGARIQRLHNFQTGDRIIYHTNGNPITGLQDDGIYYVRRIDASTIKLANSLTEANAPLFGFGKGQVDSAKDELNLGANLFANGQAVTYRAPAASTFTAGQVNVDSNTIELANQTHGYVTGQKVIYSSKGDAIGNLGQNREYFVIRLDDHRFKLADSKKNAEDGKAIDLTSGGSDEQSVRPLSIAGLVDGQTYYVVKTGDNTFKLAASPGGAVIGIDANDITGTHFIGVEGIDLNNASASGNQSLQLDIDSTSATGANHRLIGAGGALTLATPSSADGIATANTNGSSGKLIGTEGARSTVNANATVNTTVNDGVTLTAGGNVTVLSDSTNNAGAIARNRQGSFIATGKSFADTIASNTNILTTGNGVVINAGGSVDLKSVSSQQGTTYADAQGKGVVPFADSNATTTVNYTTRTNVGQGNQITANDNVLINSVSSNDGSSRTYAQAKGLGNDSNAIATVNSNGSTQTEISPNATLKAAVVALDAHAGSLKTDVSASSYGAGLGATTKAETNSTVNDQTNVMVRSGATLSGSDRVNLLSQQDSVNTSSRANGELDAFGGDTDVFANNTQNTNATVLTEAGSKIKTGLLNVEADTESRIANTNADRDGAVFDDGDSSANTPLTTNRSISFNSTLSAEVDPELVIDANGNVIRAYNAGIQDTDNTVIGPVQANDIGVNDLKNDTVMQVNFAIPNRGYGQAGVLAGNPVFQRSYDRVDITNRSDKDLVVNEINVINPNNPVYARDVQNQSGFAPGANVLSSTVVNVQNQNTGDVVLNSKIYNPHAETVIHNTGGDVLSRGSNALIETRDLNITSDQGGIGTSEDRVKAQIVQGFEGDTSRDTALTAIANKALYMDLQGVVQDSDGLVINAKHVVSTTNDVNLKLRQAVNQVNAPVPSTYQFDDLRAGGNVIIDAASNDINVIGNIDIVNDGKLDVVTGGNVNLTESTGKLDVKRVISSNGSIQLTVKDAPTVGQDLILNSASVVSAAQGAVMLLAGDDVKMAMGATLTAGTTATVQGDIGNADNGTGSEIALRGAVNAAQVVVTGGSDADTVSLREATGYTQSTVDLGAGNDTFDGGAGKDAVTAGAGDDTLNGNGGDDALSGGDGKDTILGGAGNDQIDAGAGDDTVKGGTGNDTISGGDGKDNLSGEAGRDRINGGAGDDAIQGGDNNDTIFGDDGKDAVDGGAGDDDLHGGSGADLVKGGNDNDAMFGDAGEDDLEGGAGNDAMSGGSGNDSLVGDSGNDQLQGDAGDDYLEGGAGGDIFSAVEDGDIVADFGDGADSLG